MMNVKQEIKSEAFFLSVCKPISLFLLLKAPHFSLQDHLLMIWAENSELIL